MKKLISMSTKIITKFFCMVLLILLVAILIIGVLFLYKDNAPVLKKNYINNIETGGVIEQHYLQKGDYETSCITMKVEDPMKKLTIYYPSELESSGNTYPMVLLTNGTGFKATMYKSQLERLASWGFIVVGNQDKGTGTGETASLTLEKMLKENEDETSLFYHKIDTNNIGITGFSQGGAAVMRAITLYENSKYFKTAISLSPVNEETAAAVGYPYDLTKIDIPLMMLAGTSGEFELDIVIPYEAMNNMFDKISAPKIMARRVGADHDKMMYSADGYVTAWLMWQLNGDEEAAKVFIGDNPEILNNQLYQNQQVVQFD